MPQSFFKENRGVVGKGRVEGESSYFVLIVITTKIHAVASYTCTAIRVQEQKKYKLNYVVGN